MEFLIILQEFIPLHHVILLKVLLCFLELNTLDACWIAVDEWSNSSRCRQESVYFVSDVMPIYMIIPRYSHNYAQFCQLLNSNSFTHRKILMLLREATSEIYGPGSIFIISTFLHFIISFAFILLFIFITKIPK